ncbi:6-pyruvoyl tetrahydrobiopterin synthase [Candidatus Marinamargulisbacteria bacterium SCGC AG-414-C22]|nr:6-pyruvoyl tetrahydrobiopterin synthase [Candidatus Marinamargulisbacteria bacterium SCGC AG-414-C22]
MTKNYVYLTHRSRFSASHQLNNKTLSETENQELFGKCTHIHGHNFELFVTLKDTPRKKTGMILNVAKIKEIIEKYIINEFDHNHLNQIIEFNNVLPTTENLCIVIWNRLKPHFKEQLYKISVKETENIQASYKGE